MAKYASLNIGTIEAVVNKLGGLDGVKRFLSSEVRVARFDYDVIGRLRLLAGAEAIEVVPQIDADLGIFFNDIPQVFLDPFALKEEISAKIQVFEMEDHGTWAQIYKSLPKELDSLCMKPSQIISFVQKHREWLRPNGYGNFFLFKQAESFFVANVNMGNGLCLNVGDLTSEDVWNADRRHRFILPKLIFG